MSVDVNKILDAVNMGLGVIKTVASTPGISMLPYVNTVSGAVDLIQFAIGAGKNIAGLVDDFKDTFKGGVPTQAQLDALDAKIAAKRAELHAPLPPKEDGEPD